MQKINKVDRLGQIPAYIQVASELRRRIEMGDWLPGEKISTLEELEQEFQVARVTVRQAVGILEQEGLVKRQQGRGTFVNKHVNNKRWLRLETTWESVITSIEKNVPKFIHVENPPPLPKLQEDEGELASKYVFLRSVQLKDGIPYGVVSLHLAQEVFDKHKKAFLKHTALSVLGTLDDVHIKGAHQTMVIGTADRETADLLQVCLSAPTAACRCVVTDQNNVAIYVADITYRSDCLKLHMDLLDRANPAVTPARRAQ